MIEDNLMRTYKQAVTKEFVTRLCMLLPLVVFVGAMLTHQSLATIVVLFCIYTAIFTAFWFPAILDRAKCLNALIKGSAANGVLPLSKSQAFPASADHQVPTPPPRTPPEN